ncbi:hypothetical protein STENM223S_03186 [Streptomyces tendae]
MTAADPVADGSMSQEEYALEQAKASGQPYELLSARTEASDTWALPDGSWSVKRHSTPVRMIRDGAWIPTDATLAFAGDGRVSPKATTVAVSFSGGGTDPMLIGVKDGRTLALTWPKALPKPTLTENVATYAEVLPGVDLQLKAEVEGFSQLLVVKTAQAAKNPDLASLKYELDTVGVTVTTDPDTGLLTATNPAGQTVFTSPAPMMWDSTTISSAATRPAAMTLASEGETPADAFVPPPGAQDAQMPTTVSGDTLEIKPDQELLADANTQYPVFIDPSMAWGDYNNWTRVYKAYPDNSYWNSKDVLRVGYEAQTGGSNRVSRSFFQTDISEVSGAQIKSATFRIKNTWSWSCQSRPVELHTVGPISKKTTWNNQPAKGALLDTVNDSKGWSSSIKDCAAGNLEFDATNAVATASGNHQDSVNFGLYATDETDTFGWKKFDPKSFTLEIKYNHAPDPPKDLGTSPQTTCDDRIAGGINGYNLIGNARISWYDYSDGHDEIHTFAPNSDGSFQAPVHAWTTKSGNYTASRMKRTTGDFNGDGIGDIAALYGYPDGRVALITWTGTGDEQKPFNDPVHSWKTAAGNWTFDNVRIQSGDFNGDGRDDIAAWYAYSSGADQLYTFTANIKGGFNSPFKSFYAAQGWWAKNMKFATGDYNGDGRDDLGVFYGYEEGGVELLTFTTQPTGAFKAPIHGWESSTWGSFDRTTLHSGDFNGDGRDDIATWYDYADGQDAIISFNPSGTDGKFGNRQEVWRASTDNFTRSNMKIVTGDYNGDGRDDFGAIYGYSTGGVRTLTWTAKADGKLNNHIGGWEIKDNSWTFDRMHAIERYSPA